MSLSGLRALDRRLFVVISRRAVPFGSAIRRLSDFADHSLLWGLVAAILAATGGRRGRRAAARGLSCIAVASLVANQPAKRVFRRARPVLSSFPDIRLPRHMPISTSFPSGHSASAFAFAAGAAAELPGAARGPLLALAGAVGFSRVYVGAHYPGDVLAGAAIGTAVAAGSLRLRPIPVPPHAAGPRQPHVDAPALPDGDGLALVVNPDAGSELDPDRLRERLPRVRVVERREDEDLLDCLRAAAAAPGTRVLGVAGGDGSANAAIGVALAAGLPLLVLPGGTLNHLCRDLGLESVDEALDALRAGRAVAADVGDLGGEPFANTASFGGYPEFVARRERLEDRIGKRAATVVAGLRTLRHAEPCDVQIDGVPARVWLIFIGNCRYLPAGPAPAARERLDDGRFDVRLLDAAPRLARLRLLAAIVAGRPTRSSSLRCFTAGELRVRSLDGPLRTARDGEVSDHETDGFAITKRAGRVVLYAGA
jgi:undecaprenyl-diphosphatase